MILFWVVRLSLAVLKYKRRIAVADGDDVVVVVVASESELHDCCVGGLVGLRNIAE